MNSKSSTLPTHGSPTTAAYPILAEVLVAFLSLPSLTPGQYLETDNSASFTIHNLLSISLEDV
jgi:hypothetical protein